MSCFGGDRGLEIGIVDVTQGERSKEDKRLYELFTKDVNDVLVKQKVFKQFGWNENGVVRVIPAAKLKGVFRKMIITDKAASIGKVAAANDLYDGLICYEYDKAGKQVRLKLFDGAGKELILLRIKLAQKGVMKNSLYKRTRQGAMIAIGAAVDFVP